MKTLDPLQSQDGSKPPTRDIYNVDNDNIVCLEIYHCLLEAFHECEQHCPKYLNIVAIFFHHLMRLLTGCVLKSLELKHGNVAGAEFNDFKPLNEFPWVGYYELTHGRIDIHAKSRFLTAGTHLTNKQKWVNLVSNILKGRKRVAISGVDNNIRYILWRLASGGITPYFPTYTKVHIPNYCEQIEVIEKIVRGIISLYSVNIDASELISMFEKFISPFLDAKIRDCNFDLLLTGTMLCLESRVIAAGAMSQGKPVVAISHGEGDLLIVDEPRSGYGELSLSTSYIGYGQHGKLCIDDSLYMKSLYDQPSFVSASSNICKVLYQPGKEIPTLKHFTDPVVMYVPTNFIGTKRYGPFHSLSDVAYCEWQKVIYEQFPHAVYKKHPKDQAPFSSQFTRIERRSLIECLDMADVFVLDCISTAFNLVAATSKPIIFFDIGLRNIHTEALSDIKKRTVWIDAISDKSSRHLNEQIKRQEAKTLENSYTTKFCINRSDAKREAVIVDVLLKALKEGSSVKNGS